MPTIEARRQTKRGRFYEIARNGEAGRDLVLYPSVTTILSAIGKPALLNWMATQERTMVSAVSADLYEHTLDMEAPLSRESWMEKLALNLGNAKAGEKELAKASELGSMVHHAIEQELNKTMGLPFKEVVLSDAAKLAFRHWGDWAASVDLEPIASEQVIWSHKYRYAGTLDLLAKVNGKLAVIDWKTGKFVYGEAHLQNAAYRQAIREMGHGDPVEGYIVRLPKVVDDPKFEAVAADAEAPSMEVFLNVQALWLWQEERQAKWEATQ